METAETADTSTTVSEPLDLPDPSRATSARSVPTHNWRAHWLTAAEFARMMGRDPQTVYKWLRNGTLAEFGVPVCQFRHGKVHSGRTFIQNIY